MTTEREIKLTRALSNTLAALRYASEFVPIDDPLARKIEVTEDAAEAVLYDAPAQPEEPS